MVSVEDILKKKFIYPDDTMYKLVPLMHLFSWKCWHCGVLAVAKTKLGVERRLMAHIRKEHPKEGGFA